MPCLCCSTAARTPSSGSGPRSRHTHELLEEEEEEGEEEEEEEEEEEGGLGIRSVMKLLAHGGEQQLQQPQPLH